MVGVRVYGKMFIQQNLFVVGMLFLVFSSDIYCHENWLDVENYYPKEKERVRVFVKSGHNFPESGSILDSRYIWSPRVIFPDGKTTIFATNPDKENKCLSGSIVFESSGVYLISLALKNPQLKQPNYWLKSILICGKSDNKNKYIIGEGLEIVPEKEITSLRKGKSLPVVVLYNGEMLETTISVFSEGGDISFLKTRKARPALVKLKSKGRYLITTSYKGIRSSLTFFFF